MASNHHQPGALIRKRTDMELMPPPPAPKRIKRPKEVLDEDTYTDSLSKIIARDFFPGLLESETQQEYLDALESKDDEWISSASRRLQSVMTPGRRRAGLATPRPGPHPNGAATPMGYAGDTPSAASVASSALTQEQRSEIDTNMSLGAFQAKYTSEDNESFYKLLDKQNAKRAQNYAWLWSGNKLPSKQMLKQREVQARLAETGTLEDDGFTKRDCLAIKDKDDRPAAPEAWNARPDNAFMFGPEGVEDGADTVARQSEARSRAGPKTIVYENTRMPGQHVIKDDGDNTSVPASPSLSAVRDALNGVRRPEDRTSTTAGSETPRVNGYAFVDDEEPEQKPPSRSHFAQIGLGPGDATPNPFQIQEHSKREGVHRRMVERIAKMKRASQVLGATGKVEKTPVPKFPSSPRVTGGLTPAAQRLWGKIGTPTRSGGGGSHAFDTTPGRATPAKRKPSSLGRAV